MEIEFLSSFSRDLKKLGHKATRKAILKKVEEITLAQNIQEIKQLKKLEGHKEAYRIRIGDYRIGVFITDNKVEFARLIHRKEIYRYFP